MTLAADASKPQGTYFYDPEGLANNGSPSTVNSVNLFNPPLLGLAAAAALPASALTTGDLAFTAFNADEDGFAIVALASVAANTQVCFSDNEWSGTAFNTGESFSSWLSGAVVVNTGFTVSVVPEPETYALMLAGLGALGLLASRRA